MDEDLKARLLKPRLPEDTVDVEGIGTIRVRGLSRGEVFAAGQLKGVEAQERRFLSLGMVDPEMSEDDVKLWQRNSPAGELEPVTVKIQELSGLAQTAAKQAMISFRDDTATGVRDVPGAKAVDDGGEAAAGDAG